MALSNAYLVTTKNLDAIFNAILTAQAPEKFNHKFLKDLDFSSSNDRLYIGVLRALDFIDDTGSPTQRYYNYLDQSQSGIILAEAVKEAYADLFQINKNANELTFDEVKNKFRTLTQGQKSDNVLTCMANTFVALCAKADWKKTKTEVGKPEKSSAKEQKTETLEAAPIDPKVSSSLKDFSLNYAIQIHLPETRDIAVYDAIFTSLKKHLI